VLADPGQVEHEHRLEVEAHLFGLRFDVRVAKGRPGRAGQIVFPVGPPRGVISRPVRVERAETEGDLVPAGALIRRA